MTCTQMSFLALTRLPVGKLSQQQWVMQGYVTGGICQWCHHEFYWDFSKFWLSTKFNFKSFIISIIFHSCDIITGRTLTLLKINLTQDNIASFKMLSHKQAQSKRSKKVIYSECRKTLLQCLDNHFRFMFLWHVTLHSCLSANLWQFSMQLTTDL